MTKLSKELYANTINKQIYEQAWNAAIDKAAIHLTKNFVASETIVKLILELKIK